MRFQQREPELTAQLLSDRVLLDCVYGPLLSKLFAHSAIELVCEHLQKLTLSDVLFMILLDFCDKCLVGIEQISDSVHTAKAPLIKLHLDEVAPAKHCCTLILYLFS